MQRGPYSNMGPAQSPPLHHPVPQHVSTVPQLRSPRRLSHSNNNSSKRSSSNNMATLRQTTTATLPSAASSTTPPLKWASRWERRPSLQVRSTWSKTSVETCRSYSLDNFADPHSVQPLCQRVGSEALLQRLQLLRRQQALHRLVPMAPSSVVATAAANGQQRPVRSHVPASA